MLLEYKEKNPKNIFQDCSCKWDCARLFVKYDLFWIKTILIAVHSHNFKCTSLLVKKGLHVNDYNCKGSLLPSSHEVSMCVP